jgi:ribosomal protein L37E
MTYECPACGYPDLDEQPRTPGSGGSYEICASCGFEFGYTDEVSGFTYETWRARWIALGTPWDSTGIEDPPAGWDPQAQLGRLST